MKRYMSIQLKIYVYLQLEIYISCWRYLQLDHFFSQIYTSNLWFLQNANRYKVSLSLFRKGGTGTPLRGDTRGGDLGPQGGGWRLTQSRPLSQIDIEKYLRKSILVFSKYHQKIVWISISCWKKTYELNEYLRLDNLSHQKFLNTI